MRALNIFNDLLISPPQMGRVASEDLAIWATMHEVSLVNCFVTMALREVVRRDLAESLTYDTD